MCLPHLLLLGLIFKLVFIPQLLLPPSLRDEGILEVFNPDDNRLRKRKAGGDLILRGNQ